jgi:hypothetical protein
MQVDTAQLRRAAARLRQDVAKRLETSCEPGRGVNVDGAFDLYTTAAPYTEAATAWAVEIGLLIRATTQLAEALESAADDYDKSDERSARRMTATR